MHTSFAKFHKETKTTKASCLHWVFCHKPHDRMDAHCDCGEKLCGNESQIDVKNLDIAIVIVARNLLRTKYQYSIEKPQKKYSMP
jgi:hypothetical protein